MTTTATPNILSGAQVGPDPYDPFAAASNPNPPKPRFNFLSAKDMLQPQPDIVWIVKNFLAEASLSIVYADGGSLKTYSMIDMGVCVATFEKWLNHEVTQGAVLIIDEDNGPPRMLRRNGEVLRGHGADENTPIYCLSSSGFDFGKDIDIEYLKLAIDVHSVKLVIIDTLINVMPGKKENAAEEINPILLKLRRVAHDTGAAIVLIHHSNKAGGFRGTTVFKDAVDTLISVEKKQNEIIFKTEKSRDGEIICFSAIANFDAVNQSFRLDLNPKQVKPMSTSTYTKADRFVLLYLLSHGESKSSDITGSIDPLAGDPAPKSVSNSISSLKTNQLIERTDNGTAGTVGTYQLTLKGEEEAQSL